jgi:putative MATE family efflux protein
MRDRMLKGSVIKSIFAISVPVIFANVLQTVYQLIDTYWVGRLGANSVAAVSLSFPILFFLTSFAIGIAMAGAILIAQFNGKGERDNVGMAAGQTFTLVTLLAIGLSVIGFFSSGPLLSYLTDSPEVLGQATSYLKLSFLGLTAMFIYNIFQASLRGVGEVKIPMLIILATVIINFFLDPLLMFGWGVIPAMGIAGVALATVITQTLSAIAGVILLIKGIHGLRISPGHLVLKPSWAIRLIKLGLPSSIEHSSRSFGMMLLTFVISGFGTLAIAAYGIGTRILSFIVIPAIGLSVATAALVGNNLGARQKARAHEIVAMGMKLGFWTLSFFGILLLIFAPALTAFFVPGEAEVIALGALFIRIMALSFGFIGIQMVVIGALKASGKTPTAMGLAILHTLSLFILSLGLSKGFGVLGVWIAYPSANLVALGAAWYIYKKKSWLSKELV